MAILQVNYIPSQETFNSFHIIISKPLLPQILLFLSKFSFKFTNSLLSSIFD